MASEKYFPRGPIKTTESTTFKTRFNRKSKEKPLVLFKKKRSAVRKCEPNKQKHEKKKYEKLAVKLNNVSRLQYETLQEGFLVVGCVKEIYSTQITVTLPGCLVAQVKINKVSDPLNSLLSSYTEGDVLPENVPSLNELFKIGELVTCCVEEVFTTERGTHKVLLSLNPSTINRDKTERILEENVVLIGAVKSKEDHGYSVDLGIEGVTAFLPFKRTSDYLLSENCETLSLGKIIRVAVRKVLRANVGVTTVELTLEPDVVSKAVPRSGFTVDNLTPGQQMNVFIKQIISNGIEVSPVHAFEDYSSYVNIAYVPDVWGNASGLVPGKIFSATLLYSLTPVNILYFSLKTYSSGPDALPCFQDGTIIKDAKVIALAKHSIYLQLGSRNLNAKGIVSSKQSGGITSFSVGQTYKTRILHYDFLEKVYICSLNRDVISADVFSTKDLRLGQTVKCTVIKFQEGKGLIFKLGTLNAFSPIFHLTDHPHRTQTAIANLYKINSVVTAKVLRITEGNEVILTLKPTLLSSEALCRLEDAVRSKHYYGTINSIIGSGINVRFFGDTFGFIPNRLIAPHITGLSKESFHTGQVIRCYVSFVNPSEKKLILSLIPDAASDLKLGNLYQLEVNQCYENGLEVTVAGTFLGGRVPLHQVTDHINLLSCFTTNYGPGKIIENAVLYSFTEDLTPLFTLRTSVKKFLKANPWIFSDNISNVVYNLVVPCCVSKVEESGIRLNILLPGFSDSYVIPQENLSDDQQNLDNFKENQALMAVVKSNQDSFDLSVSSTNFTCEFKAGFDMLEDYLIQAAEFQVVTLCEKCRVLVTSVTENVVNVKLVDKKLIGSFSKEFSSKNYKKNDKLEAVVLWQDPKTQHVFVHPDLDLKVRTKVDEELKSFSGSIEESRILLILEEIIVGVILSGNCSGQLTFIPSRTHFNNFTRKKPSLLSVVRVIHCKLVNGLVVSEREKRIKTFSKQSGNDESLIISELLKYNVNRKTSMEKESNRKKRRKSSESAENHETKHVTDVKIRRSDSNDSTVSNIDDAVIVKGSLNENVNKKTKRSKKGTDDSRNCDLEVGNDLNDSNEWSKMNGSHLDEESLELGKKKKKRKISESDNFSGSEENTNNVSPVKAKKKDKLINTSVALNGFNVTSCETIQNEELPKKKTKKRKTSISFDVEDVCNIDDTQNTVMSELSTDKKGDVILSADNCLNSRNINNDVISQKLGNCKGNKLIKSVTHGENPDPVAGRKNKIKNPKFNDDSNKNNDDNDDNDEYERIVKNDSLSKGDGKPRLSLSGSGKFFWNVNAKDFSVMAKDDQDDEDGGREDDVDDDQDVNEKATRPKTAAEKKAAAKEAEKRLRQAEQQLLEAESNPQSVDHFERLSLSQPNNSLIWVKYMAYHLQATEIEKARAVANRALKVISHREEQERLNVWVALLNLENLYGAQESLKKTLDDAVRSNDEYKVYSKMAEIYTDSNKHMELDHLTTQMVKKFKTDMECWLLCCRCLLKSGLTEKARSIFQRGLQTLLKKEHIQYITRFALMENTFGSSEHAQTLMEHVLTTYPGRIPSWFTYIDMLIKSGQIDLARNVLERAVGQKLPVKKMKTLYKKWLQFEEQHGSEALVSHVREAAENYVNSLNSAISSV